MVSIIAFSWLASATPLWLSLALIGAFASLAWQIRAMGKRLDRHARSIAHMDDWADSVDHKLAQIEGRNWRLQSAAAAARPSVAPRKWWQQ